MAGNREISDGDPGDTGVTPIHETHKLPSADPGSAGVNPAARSQTSEDPPWICGEQLETAVSGPPLLRLWRAARTDQKSG